LIRLRPILLAASAATLGMIPIAPTIFWDPMAYAIAIATVLTLIFLPALYVAWFLIKAPDRRRRACGRLRRRPRPSAASNRSDDE
jgi:Cu/Ag efflux pump CusA